MLKAFVRDTAIYGLLRVLTNGLSILLLPLYTRMLPPAEYGVVDLVAVASAVLMVVVSFEIVQAMARLTAGVDDARRRSYVSTAFWFVTGTFSLMVITVAIAAPAISRLAAGVPHYALEMRLAAVAVALQSLLYLVLSDLRFALRPWSYAAGSIVFSVVSVGTAVLYVGVLHLGLVGVFLAQVTANGAALALSLWLARRDIGLTFESVLWRQMLRFSAPLVLSSVGVLAAMYADRIAVRSLLSVASLGVYAVGARLASAVAVVINAFSTALSPLIYRHHADEGSAAQIDLMFRIFLLSAVLMVSTIGIFAREILAIIATPAYAGAVQVVFLLALAAVMSNLYLFAPGLWIANRTDAIAAVNIAAAVATVTLNLVMIPWFGIRGAAIAACLVGAGSFSTQVAMGQRFYRIPYSFGRIAAAGLIVVALAVGATRPGADSWSSPFAKSGLLLACGFFAAMTLVRPSELAEARRALSLGTHAPVGPAKESHRS